MDPMMKAVHSTDTGPVQDRYQLAVAHLRKEYAAYVFKKPKYATMSIMTWAKSLKDSEVFRYGTSEDLKALAARKRKEYPDASGPDIEMLEQGLRPAKFPKYAKAQKT